MTIPGNSLLNIVGTVPIPARIERFVARDKFVVDTSYKAQVKIFWIGSSFEDLFFSKSEEPMPESALRYALLTCYSVDDPILAELGENRETTLAQLYLLLERQKKSPCRNFIKARAFLLGEKELELRQNGEI